MVVTPSGRLANAKVSTSEMQYVDIYVDFDNSVAKDEIQKKFYTSSKILFKSHTDVESEVIIVKNTFEFLDVIEQLCYIPDVIINYIYVRDLVSKNRPNDNLLQKLTTTYNRTEEVNETLSFINYLMDSYLSSFIQSTSIILLDSNNMEGTKKILKHNGTKFIY